MTRNVDQSLASRFRCLERPSYATDVNVRGPLGIIVSAPRDLHEEVATENPVRTLGEGGEQPKLSGRQINVPIRGAKNQPSRPIDQPCAMLATSRGQSRCDAAAPGEKPFYAGDELARGNPAGETICGTCGEGRHAAILIRSLDYRDYRCRAGPLAQEKSGQDCHVEALGGGVLLHPFIGGEHYKVEPLRQGVLYLLAPAMLIFD